MSLYKVTFSILKIVESKNGNLSVYPINALYDKCDITSERDMLYVCFEKIKDAL